MSSTPTSDERQLAAFIAGDEEGMGALNHKMGVKILEASAERVVATMPVEGNTQPYGLLHGGASVVLAESLGSLGSAIHAHPDRISVGVDINATHHRAATRGLVTAVATPLHLGRSMASYEVVVTDDQDRRVCTCRITCALLPKDRGQKPASRGPDLPA
jgi:1,4-dihydroxy-2-naphthoyl-CoA hydrolase